MKTSFYKKKNILITGGTGSIGSEILKKILELNPKSIRIFSRDEYKQHKLRYKYLNNKFIEYILGDVRDFESLNQAAKGSDIIFHCAALKHVPISEEMPEEFVKTNILGAINIKRTALINEIPLVVSISTDKAVNPSNVMGLTKALQERIFTSNYIRNKNSATKFINVRFGNVIGTHGSLFPIIYHQILNKLPITVTDPEMTRFFMSKEEAIELIFWAAKNGNNGDTIIKKMKSVAVKDVIEGFFQALNISNKYLINTIGLRVGEKFHESLITEDEFYRIKEKQNYYMISPYTKLDIKKNIIVQPRKKLIIANIDKFCSNFKENFLSKKEILSYVRKFIKEVDSKPQII